MKKYPDYLRNRIWQIRRESDLNKEDIEALIFIVKVATTITAKENLLLSNGVCPKCGKKIGQRPIYHGGTEEDPVPYAVTYIIGCEECDYELNRETIDL